MPVMQQVVLGVDAGTHGVRILAVRPPECAVVAQSAGSYHRRTADGVQELDALELERAFFEALNALDFPQGTSVAGLGITHQRGTVIPVDEMCRPLAPAFCDSDERAMDAAGYRDSGVDPDEYYHRSGCPVVSFNGFSKILWCKQHLPGLYSQAVAWLSPQDYLLSRLSGYLQLSEGSVMRNGFLDIHQRIVCKTLLPGAPFLHVPCAAVGESCGAVSDFWAAQYPILKRTALIAVPGDQPAAVLGSGVTAGKVMAMNLGTTFVASTVCDHPADDPTALITTEVLPHGRYAPEFGTGAGGQFLDFLTALLYGETPQDTATWAQLDAAAAAVPAGAQGLRIVPLLWQVTSANIDGRMTGLRPFHTRDHFLRAAYEGLAFEARLSIEKLSSCTAVPEAIRVFGGLSSCDCFLQILSSVTGKIVEAAGQKQASAFGAGLTCALGLGILRTADDLRAAAGNPCRVLHPNREEQANYENEFKRYQAQR